VDALRSMAVALGQAASFDFPYLIPKRLEAGGWGKMEIGRFPRLRFEIRELRLDALRITRSNLSSRISNLRCRNRSISNFWRNVKRN